MDRNVDARELTREARRAEHDQTSKVEPNTFFAVKAGYPWI